MKGYEVNLPRWEWRNRVLYFVDVSGTVVLQTADEIYRALVEQVPTNGDGEAAHPEGLRISRYPLVPSLTLNLNDQGVPTLALTGNSRGTLVDLLIADLERGHVVSGSDWFPVDASSALDVTELLAEVKGGLGPCSLRTFVALRNLGPARGVFEDRLGDRPISALAFTPSCHESPNVNATLYPYQLTGWSWLRFVCAEGFGGLLADEMGLGKSLQVIAALHDSMSEAPGPSLIVAPGSLLENWQREISRFAPTLRTLKHHGSRRSGRPKELQDFDVVITSYDTVVRDNSLLNMVPWDVVVLDEAQFIRNPDALRTKVVKKLRRRVGLAVTGTPVENRLLDLWSIFDFAVPGQLGDRKSFEARYPDDLGGAEALEIDASPFMLRRRIREVAQDLPPRIDIPQLVELSEDEASAYEATRMRIVDEYGAAATLVALTELRQFCAHPDLLVKRSGNDPMQFSKFQRLDELLREIFLRREKVLIFTSFTAMGDMIAQHVQSSLRKFAGIIDGRLPIDERQPLIDQFSEQVGAAALVLNPHAGGSGLNITAANHVVHYNPEWNPALQDQASARAYRRGQELPVTVHRLLVPNTVEEVISDRMDRKRAISESAVVGIAGQKEDYLDIVAALTRSPLQ